MKGIIAEIGNSHEGWISKAKELIVAAKESGCNYVKFQAIDPEKITTGSMPSAFYHECSFTLDQYIELAEYAKRKDIIPFFSIFGEKYKFLRSYNYYKISGHQYLYANPGFLKKYNFSSTLISVPENAPFSDLISEMNIMHVTPYNCTNPDLTQIKKLSRHYKKDIGLSDHSIGIDTCIRAIDSYNVKLIEKHFYLGGDIFFANKLYRDCTHSANPNEMKNLCDYFKERII